MGMYRDIRYVDLSENEDHPPIAGKLMIGNQVLWESIGLSYHEAYKISPSTNFRELKRRKK